MDNGSGRKLALCQLRFPATTLAAPRRYYPRFPLSHPATSPGYLEGNRLANTAGFLLRLLTMAPITFKWTPFAALPSGSHPLTKFLLTPFSVSVSGRVAGLSEKYFKAAR